MLWLFEWLLAAWGVHKRRRAITPLWQALRTTVTYARTPTSGNAQSLSFPFHSVWRHKSEFRYSKSGVSLRARRGGASSPSVEVSETLGRSPGYALRHPPHSKALEIGSRRSPCVTPRGSFRPSVLQLLGDLLDHEHPAVEGDRVTGALALQLSIDRGLGRNTHDLIAVAHKFACRHGNNKKSFA